MTGIASNKVTLLDIEHAAQIAKSENERVSDILGVNKAARVTCVKPSGTASCVLGTSSGIHAWFAPYYIRRVRMNKMEDVYNYLLEKVPELIEDDYFNSSDAVFSIPQKAPTGNIITRKESAIHLLERVKRFAIRWVDKGHKDGMNSHNVSATINIKDDEWDTVGQWMWMNRHYYNGLAVMAHDGGKYPQLPFEEISKSKYKMLCGLLTELDFSEVIETDDNTDFGNDPACAGGYCEI